MEGVTSSILVAPTIFIKEIRWLLVALAGVAQARMGNERPTSAPFSRAKRAKSVQGFAGCTLDEFVLVHFPMEEPKPFRISTKSDFAKLT